MYFSEFYISYKTYNTPITSQLGFITKAKEKTAAKCSCRKKLAERLKNCLFICNTHKNGEVEKKDAPHIPKQKNQEQQPSDEISS